MAEQRKVPQKRSAPFEMKIELKCISCRQTMDIFGNSVRHVGVNNGCKFFDVTFKTPKVTLSEA